MKPTIFEHFKSVLFHIFPHHWVSRATFMLTRIRTPFAHWVIRAYIRFFNVDMTHVAKKNLEDYACFDDFFTRELKPDARPIGAPSNDTSTIVSPCDGRVIRCDAIHEGSLLQAKEQDYTVAELLGDDNLAQQFYRGSSCTIYLSPADYHRVHMPLAGTLQSMTHIPGRLFSVSEYAWKTIPRVFARNERVINLFHTEHGSMAVILVGALNVGCIETVWHGIVTPKYASPKRINYATAMPSEMITLARGDLMASFHLGSTAIILFEVDNINWDTDKTTVGHSLLMGEAIAQIDATS